MAPLRVALRVVAGSADQDRLVHRIAGDTHFIVLADGAGGVAGGGKAADFVVSSAALNLTTPESCAAELGRLDRAMVGPHGYGETTAVLLAISAGQLFGASVGDSGVWTCHREASFDLTARQHRKPLLGSGAAQPVSFGPHYFNDRVLVASDGLLKYVPPERIRSLALLDPLLRALDELIAAARLPSGRLQDDLAIALVDQA